MVIQMASENACGWGGWCVCVCRCIARRQCEGSWSAPLSLLKFVVPLAARADIVGGKLLALPLHPLVRPSPDTQTEHLNPRAPPSLLR